MKKKNGKILKENRFIVDALGIKLRHNNFDYKTKFEWRLEYQEYHDETLNKQFPFTIYDYKEDWDQYEDNSTDNDYLYTTKIDWHIGSKSYDYAILVQDWLKNELNKLRNEG